MTTTITKQAPAEGETQIFLQSDLTAQDWQERQADELAIQVAGKDRLEKALIIGERLSNIYNSGTFRREAPGGEVWSWADWVEKRLPEILPEAGKKDWADERRWLHEVRSCLPLGAPSGAPTTQTQARALTGLSLIHI